MGRYIVKFTKLDSLKYISHLDLMRLFRRSFKRSDIMLSYSQGYNPHAKISFAQPLSLGFESTGEYAEIETKDNHDSEHISDELNKFFPSGLKIIMCKNLRQIENVSKNTVSASVRLASYRLTVRTDKGGYINEKLNKEVIDSFFNREEILAEKMKKKKVGRNKTIRVAEMKDIKQMIDSYQVSFNDNCLNIDIDVDTGSKSNLNPEVVIEALSAFSGITTERSSWNIMRLEMYYTDKDGKKKSLSDFEG